MTRLKCICCDHVLGMDDMLKAPNPFDASDTIVGCPECKEVNCFQMACDEPGCLNLVSIGTPMPDGYRSTCGEHMPGVTP